MSPDAAREGKGAALRGFRDGLYSCFERRRDALFELNDALLAAGTVPSPAHLSLAPGEGGAILEGRKAEVR